MTLPRAHLLLTQPHVANKLNTTDIITNPATETRPGKVLSNSGINKLYLPSENNGGIVTFSSSFSSGDGSSGGGGGGGCGGGGGGGVVVVVGGGDSGVTTSFSEIK